MALVVDAFFALGCGLVGVAGCGGAGCGGSGSCGFASGLGGGVLACTLACGLAAGCFGLGPGRLAPNRIGFFTLVSSHAFL